MEAKVLLVDADATSGADLRSALARSGYAVTLVRDGHLGLARAVSEHFDAVVVAADLPGLNGFRLCNRIRKDPNVGNVRLFILGGEADAFAAHERLTTRADSYFTLPVVPAELIARMRLHGVGEGPSRTPKRGTTLDADLAAANRDLATIAELRKRVAEQDSLLERTTRDLAQARAAIKTSVPPPPPPKHASVIPRKPAPRLPSGQRSKDPPSDPKVDKGLRDRVTALEEEKRSLEQRLREQARVIASAEKKEEAHAAERDATEKRIAELGARVDKSRADADAAKTELRERLAALMADHQAELDGSRAQREKLDTEWKRAAKEHADDRVQRDQEHTRELLLAAGTLAKLREQVSVLEARLRMTEAHSDEAAVEAQAHAQRQRATIATLEAELDEARRALAERDTQAPAADADDDHPAMTARAGELSAALAAMSMDPSLASAASAFEASLESQNETIKELEHEIDDARQEIPQLEAEIVVLRSELMNLRRQLDTQALHERVVAGQLERDRELLARAKDRLGPGPGAAGQDGDVD